MNRVKEFFKVNLIAEKDNIVRKGIAEFSLAVMGFVLSSVNIAGGVSPFGLAFVPCGGVSGFIGVLLGIWLNGEDIFRYITAAVINFISYRYLKKLLYLPDGVISFMTSLWSVLISGLLGLFVVRTSFSENCFFALSGVVSGFFSYIFLIYKNSLMRKKGIHSSKLEYICGLVTVAVVIVSFSTFGIVWEMAATILAFFSVFVVSASSGFSVSLSFSAVIGFALILSNSSNTVVMTALIFGVILSAIVAPLGKIAIFLSYAVSGAITCVYFRGETLPFLQIFDILAAGVLFLMIPKRLSAVLTHILIPGIGKKHKNIVKNKKLKKFPVKSNIKSNSICATCESCRNRFICWVKDYGYTSEVFEDFRQGIKSGNEEFPSHFKMKCLKTDTIASELKFSVLKKNDFKLEYAKCSEPKKGEKVCGDNCCVFSSGNKQIICLADGMGSGPEAAKESLRSSKLLENLISKGVEKEDAIKVINETLIKSEYETVLALDITMIDLKTGVCEFIKAGAAPTYIVRNGSLYELGTKSVPIGILDEVSLEYERSKMLSGDIILMISDGMISDGSEWLSFLIRGLSKAELQSPLLLSDSIMSAAKHLDKNFSDDLTVIAAKIV